MDTLSIERIGFLEMYRVHYNGFVCIVPWFRVDSAIIRVIRAYHNKYGGGQ